MVRPSRNCSRAPRSRPSHGSSSRSSAAFAMSALAIITFCLSPWESSLTIFFTWSPHPRPARREVALRTSTAGALRQILVDPYFPLMTRSRTFSSPGIHPSRYALTMPMRVRSSRRSVSPKRFPRISTSPRDGQA